MVDLTMKMIYMEKAGVRLKTNGRMDFVMFLIISCDMISEEFREIKIREFLCMGLSMVFLKAAFISLWIKVKFFYVSLSPNPTNSFIICGID
ncbi:hypothetical protein HanXRQr2_Chr16g0723741 [Helianthus annuus]|uniref:Uncharacterized protein n=1 Tax=Helianthus annuus TaxID=4232 RepID=A0A9K3GW11_HELAN|nr:hypothetical protein HanXRQr2_Chr16g0723741 [Helianthus annuus]